MTVKIVIVQVSPSAQKGNESCLVVSREMSLQPFVGCVASEELWQISRVSKC